MTNENTQSKMLLEVLRQNKIRGCIVLIHEEGDEIVLTHAADEVHQINVVAGLAKMILQEYEGEDDWQKLILSAAGDIVRLCDMAKKR